MTEFDPRSEKHFGLLLIKAVEPGCTTELQIENLLTGAITRLTTTDFPEDDERDFRAAVVDAFDAAWTTYCKETISQG